MIEPVKPLGPWERAELQREHSPAVKQCLEMKKRLRRVILPNIVMFLIGCLLNLQGLTLIGDIFFYGAVLILALSAAFFFDVQRRLKRIPPDKQWVKRPYPDTGER